MEHWRTPSARGPVNQYSSLREMDRFVQAVAAVGFTGLDIFDFNMAPLAEMFGSLERYRTFLFDRGIEQVSGLFHAPAASTEHRRPPPSRSRTTGCSSGAAGWSRPRSRSTPRT